MLQEVSELLGGKISTEDEAEVEDELRALEAELGPKEQTLPTVPNDKVPVPVQKESEPAPVQEERQAIPA